MRFDLDEGFSFARHKYWYILYGFILFSTMAGFFIEKTSLSIIILTYVISLLLSITMAGYNINYVSNYSNDIYYKEKIFNTFVYLNKGCRYIVGAIIGGIPFLILAFCLIKLGIIFSIISIILYIIVIYTFLLLFAKTNRMFSCFRYLTMIKIIFKNPLAISKCILWLFLIGLLLGIIIFSLVVTVGIVLTSIQKDNMIIVIFPFIAFVSLLSSIISMNFQAQLLRHISQKMGEEL